VLFLFPPDLPVTGSNMNYCVAAFGIVFIISAFQWIVDGRKNFVGPRMDVDPLEGEVAVNVAPSTADHKQEGQK
jgi:choline transport protein